MGVTARVVFASLLWSMSGGCDGDDVSDASVDATSDALPDASTITIAPPAAPMLPVLTPCPDGWRQMTVDGVAVCEPWPEAGRAECAEHEAHFPGRPGCERIGSPCPAAGGFSADIPMGVTTVYVRAGASGDGTESAPFGTIAEALVGIAPETVVAIAAGTYDEPIELPTGVTLLGACAESTHLIASTVSAPNPVVRVVGSDTQVRNVTIGPSGGLGIKASGVGQSVELRDVIVRDATSVAVLIEREASLDAERIVLRRTVPVASGLFGRGLDIEHDATAQVRWLSTEDNREWGVVTLLAELMLSDAVATGTRPNDMGGGPGFGTIGGSITAERIVGEDNFDVGLIAARGGAFDARDVVIRDTAPNPAFFSSGRSINFQEGSIGACRRCRLQRSSEVGVFISSSEATLEDTLITDVAVRTSDMQVGRGISVRDASTANLARVVIRRVHSEGILVLGESTMTATDVDIRGVLLVNGFIGRAMMVLGGSNVTMERWEVAELPEAGMLIQDPRTTVTMSDLFIHDVRSRSLDQRLGRGINVQFAASVTGERIAIEDVRDIGVAVITPDSHVSLTDVSIGPVQSVECAETTCGDDPAGHGLGVYDSASADLSRFEIVGADFCGVHVANEATAAIANGTVRGSTIGACIQSAIQDLTALSRTVQYVDNADGLVTTDLPVPTTLQDMASP